MHKPGLYFSIRVCFFLASPVKLLQVRKVLVAEKKLITFSQQVQTWLRKLKKCTV